jgi:hypothetical protein
MEETRIDRLEVLLAQFAGEFRSAFRAVDARLCKIEARLDQTATKSALGEIEVRLAKMEVVQQQNATKSDLHDLRIEMYKNNAEMKTWLLATMITIIALFCIALFGLHHWAD